MTTVPTTTDEAAPDRITRVFTFGYGHVCPHTGQDLGDHYVTVIAPDRSSARSLMNTAFGRMWAFEYDGIDDPRLADYRDRMVEHARFELTGVPS